MTSQGKLKVPKCRTELFKNTYFKRIMYLWNILPNNLRTTNVNLGQFRKSCWNYYKTFSYDPDRPHIMLPGLPTLLNLCVFIFSCFFTYFFLRWIAQYGSYCSLLSHPHCISLIDVLFFIYYFSLFCIYTVENRLN